MPKTVAQWTGLAVTAIIVFGCDLDVVYAMPLGILAGAVATFIITLDDQRRAAARLAPVRLEWRSAPPRAPES